MAAFVVYNLSNLTETLSTIVEWKKIIDNSVCLENGDPIPVYLLGNKVRMDTIITWLNVVPFVVATPD